MQLLWSAVAFISAVAGFRLRFGGEDPIIQPIVIDKIDAESSGPAVPVDENGNPVDPKSTPSPYVTNKASEYALKTTLNETLGESELDVNVTDVSLCAQLTGQVRIDAGCQRPGQKLF